MDEQRRTALNSSAKVRLIEGAAGSGKTHFGCQLALHELDSGHFVQQHQGVLFLTFARNAVARIREVICGQMAEEQRRDFQKRTRIETFCAFFWWLADAYGRYRPSGSSERIWLVAQKKNSGVYVPHGHLPYTFADVEAAALETVSIPSVIDLVAELWPLIIVDEFQDVGSKQYGIVSALGKHPATKLVLLSGPGQVLYRFLGANPEETRKRCEEDLAPKVYPIQQMNEQGMKRFAPALEPFVAAYQEGKERASAVTYRTIPDDGRPNLFGIRAAFAVQDLREDLKRSLSVAPTVAVLAATNRAACSINRWLRDGNDSQYEGKERHILWPARPELRLDDGLLMSYGRLMLELLVAHWLLGKKMGAEPPKHAVAQLTELAYSAKEADSKAFGTDWNHLAIQLCKVFSGQRPPREGQSLTAKLLSDLVQAHQWLCKTQEDLRQAGFPSNARWTPFDSGDKGILQELALQLVEAIRPAITSNTPDDFILKQHFEKYMKKRILYEKIGRSASLEVMTIHKAKGREFDGVVLVLEDEHGAPWKNDKKSDNDLFDLYYVGVSRARHALTIVATETAGREIRSCIRHLLPVSKFPSQ